MSEEPPKRYKSAGFCDGCHSLVCISDSDGGNVVQSNRMMNAEEIKTDFDSSWSTVGKITEW